MAEKKGLGALAWIGIGCGLVLVIIVVVVVAGGLFVAHKAKEAGFDVKEWKENPAVAITKTLAAADPDVEVVDIDEEKNVVTLRNTKTGEVITVDFQDIKNGNFSFESEGETVRVETTKGEKESGSMRISGDEGEMVFGAGADAGDTPEWVPLYPDVGIHSRFSSTMGQKQTGTLVQQTQDGAGQVIEYFEGALEDSGFDLTAKSSAEVDGATHATLQGTDEPRGRMVFIGVNEEDGKTVVSVRFQYEKP